jgi:hypothetical protein
MKIVAPKGSPRHLSKRVLPPYREDNGTLQPGQLRITLRYDHFAPSELLVNSIESVRLPKFSRLNGALALNALSRSGTMLNTRAHMKPAAVERGAVLTAAVGPITFSKEGATPYREIGDATGRPSRFA